jgi:hypothetical protein
MDRFMLATIINQFFKEEKYQIIPMENGANNLS